MKKNVVGRVLYQKVPAKGRLASLHIPARIVCLLLALLVWLMVSALEANADVATPIETSSGFEITL